MDLWRDGQMTLGFWEWGDAYTIVKNRHIGIDYAPIPAGQPWDVPALTAGRVVGSVQTTSTGRVVTVDTGRDTRRYISYCHGFYGDPLYRGDSISASSRVMRLARSWESPGTAWGGVHCHLVVHDHPEGAYSRVGDTYYDPAVEIAAYVSGNPAGGESQPFRPEDDVLNTDDKTWVQSTVRSEIGGALSAFAESYKDHDWIREAVRQEIGGALSAFTAQIADAVVSEIKKENE